jgi:putative phosphoesterase
LEDRAGVFLSQRREKDMKILVVSDTHGDLFNLREAMRIEAPFDMLIHLGDICHDEEEIRELAGPACTVAMVRGNCDYFCREPDTRDFTLGNHKVHMEHGHFLPASTASISYRAQELGADIMLSGHTHKPFLTECGGVTIANPGSLSKPRQSDGRPSYMVMEVDRDGEIKFMLRFI